MLARTWPTVLQAPRTRPSRSTFEGSPTPSFLFVCGSPRLLRGTGGRCPWGYNPRALHFSVGDSDLLPLGY
jgi:hypothetical protein